MSIYNQTPSEWVEHIMGQSNRYATMSQWSQRDKVVDNYYKNLEIEIGLDVDLIPDDVLVFLSYDRIRSNCSPQLRRSIQAALLSRGLYNGSEFEQGLKSMTEQVMKMRQAGTRYVRRAVRWSRTA